MVGYRESEWIKTGPLADVGTRGTSLPSFFLGLPFFVMASICIGLGVNELDWQLLVITTISAAFGASDLVDAIRLTRDIFSPRALLSIPIVIGVYITPLMHISLEAYPLHIQLPSDMSAALLNLSLIHLVGILTYFFTVRLTSTSNRVGVELKSAPLEATRYIGTVSNWMSVLGLFSLAIFIYTVIASGGPSEWLDSQLNYREQLHTPGWILVIAEAFPILFFAAYAASLHASTLNRTQLRNRMIIALLALIMLTFISSGMRGSRANLIWPLLTALIIIHLLFIRIRARWLVFIAVAILAFSGAYDLYKKVGVGGLTEQGLIAVERAQENLAYNFGIESLLMGDFSRTAIQAILLDRWDTGTFSPHWGATYVGDIVEFLPAVRPSAQFPSKTISATEILYGPGTSMTGKFTTQIYGIQGEGLINFGPVGAVLVLIPFGFIVRSMERTYARASGDHLFRSALYVALLLPCVVLLYLSDLDNVIKTLATNALLPMLAIALSGTPVSAITPQLHRRT